MLDCSGNDGPCPHVNNPDAPRVTHAMMRLPLLFTALFLAIGARAQNLTPEQFAAEARACRERARDVLQQDDDLVARFAQHARYVRAEMPKIKVACERDAALWNQTADAYDEH